MKKILSLTTLLVLFCVSLGFAQTGGMAVVTPTPTATPTHAAFYANSPQWHKYSVNLALAKTAGTGATGAIVLDSLPANSTVEAIIVKPTTALLGPSATTGTIQVKTATGSLHTAFVIIGVTPGATVFTSYPTPTAANATVWSAGDLSLTIATDAVGGPAALTAFGADVYVKFSKL